MASAPPRSWKWNIPLKLPQRASDCATPIRSAAWFTNMMRPLRSAEHLAQANALVAVHETEPGVQGKGQGIAFVAKQLHEMGENMHFTLIDIRFPGSRVGGLENEVDLVAEKSFCRGPLQIGVRVAARPLIVRI